LSNNQKQGDFIMKKLLSLLCVAIVGLTLFAFTGCANNDTFTAKSYTSGENVIESVSIDISDRQIDIGVSDDEQVHIEYFDGEKEYFDIIVSEHNVLSVKLEFNKEWTDFIGSKAAAEYRKITVKLPTTVTMLSVNTTNERIKIEQLTIADSITITNNGGNIEFNKITVGNALSLNTKNGNITGSLIGGWDDFSIKCTIKKGNSNLPAEKNGGEKSLNTNCNNGDINIEFVK
jgi:hypothetical protein